MTLKDVAQEANVHPGTVSRALNPETRALVNVATARRVESVAERLGYRPNPIARGLKTRRSFTIGVVIPDLTNPLFPPIVRGIQDVLEAAAYTPLIANTDNDPERERADFEAMRARRVDGFITATASSDPAAIALLQDLALPVVLVNRRLREEMFPSVAVDDRLGILLAVRHLADLGHTQIAHIGAPMNLSTGYNRYEGFREAMRDVGLEVDQRLVRLGDRLIESEGVRLCSELLDQKVPFTAIVAANDLLALGCYDALAERGVSCPDQVSVVGYNDMPFAARFNPPLTTIRIPHYELGAKAAELLLAELKDGIDDRKPPQLALGSSLVVRKSTAPAPTT